MAETTTPFPRNKRAPHGDVVPPMEYTDHKNSDSMTSTNDRADETVVTSSALGIVQDSFRGFTWSGAAIESIEEEQTKILATMIARREGPKEISTCPVFPTVLPPRTAAFNQATDFTALERTSSIAPNSLHLVPSGPATDSSSQPTFLFTGQDPYSGFINDSPHPIEYWGKTYPTATHLLEALRYYKSHPDCAEEIRNCQSTEEVRHISAKFQSDGKVPADWGNNLFSLMQGILYAKFTQHPSLRQLLLNTPNGSLVYYDANDEYWGIRINGSGLNVLGRVLDTVKSLLRDGSS
ncbi:hypothetical protein AMATHDRAFT_61143 [Amanita thiersii Skay4041]|uniref:NADAR domain-containing protein n=1 Tax=Amanita thiersii Skay4041 TaxID=703135 RepID=A0A2A9NK32_9AGAR|nr:hypothetical protein AMATHDRAFT_61143 [Amanita thiersii Skay4041]